MIETLKDIDLKEDDELDVAHAKIQEKLGVSVEEMTEALSSYVINKAENLTHEFPSIAPLGDYSKLLEDNDGMAEFLKNEAHKPEHWVLTSARDSDVNKELIVFNFNNIAVDDGTTFKGFVFVSLSGKIKHAFAQGE